MRKEISIYNHDDLTQISQVLNASWSLIYNPAETDPDAYIAAVENIAEYTIELGEEIAWLKRYHASEEELRNVGEAFVGLYHLKPPKGE